MIVAKSPQASVILPVYNGGRYLAEAVESVLHQSFTDFELLLLDDGSSDHSLELLRTYAARDARCRVITRQNRGLVYTLNEGVSLARAEVILRMDADDICMPTRFSKQMAYLNENPECVAVGSRVILIDPDGKSLRLFSEALDHEPIENQNLKGNTGICHPSVALRRSAVLAVGGYRDQFKHAEDLDLFLRLAEHGRLANLPDALLSYRQHPQSIGYSHRKDQVLSAQRAVVEAQIRRNLKITNWTEGSHHIEINSLVNIYQKWGWWALQSGYISTSRKYAWKSLTLQPFHLESWRIMYCALRGF